jgi:Na+/proline symporter
MTMVDARPHRSSSPTRRPSAAGRSCVIAAAPMLMKEFTVLMIAAATPLNTIAAAVLAQLSGTLVAFLGVFGWGLFASTLVPALAVGLNWEGATREGAIASIATGLAVTLGLETLAYFKVFTFPSGVSATAIALVGSLLVFFVVSWLTRGGRGAAIAPDVKLVMEV